MEKVRIVQTLGEAA